MLCFLFFGTDLAVVMNIFCTTRLDYCNSLKLKTKAP